VYELSGDTAWTYADLAAEIAAVTGEPLTHTDLSPDEHRAVLIGAGLPEELAGFLVAVEQDIKHGLLGDVSGDLRLLTGRPTTPIRDTVAEVVSSL
jgi:NAD(P)H dehydrogenase (quinone)